MRNFGILVEKRSRGFLYKPVYIIRITDGANTIEIREGNGFKVKTNVPFPKPIIFK